MTTQKKDGLHGLRSLRHELRIRLSTNPDYLALKEVESAIKKIEEVVGKAQKQRTRGKSTGKISQTGAAEAVLKKAGHPLPIGELLERVRSEGAHVGGKEPKTNLASALSKEKDRFRSVIYKETRGWWLTKEDFPGEIVVVDPDEVIIDENEMNEAEAASNESSASFRDLMSYGGQDG